jgi:hypothetical protein
VTETACGHSIGVLARAQERDEAKGIYSGGLAQGKLQELRQYLPQGKTWNKASSPPHILQYILQWLLTAGAIFAWLLLR